MHGATILVADDDTTSARFLERLFTHEGLHVRIVDTDEAILRECETSPPDLVLVDLVARGHAFTVCRQLKDHHATRLIPVVIVTAQAESGERLKAIEAGADDFVLKPFDPTELRARVRSLVRLKRYTDELESAEALIVGLGATIEARDPTTRGHCQRLSEYGRLLGRAVGLGDRDLSALARGGFLHDIGKIAVPDRVLLKNGALTLAESKLIREHPVIGDALCAGLRTLRSVRPIVRHHHERLDGSGYPDGLRSGTVPLLAQIVGIVDVFDALTTERPYRRALGHDVAFQVLAEEAEKGWRDRALVDEFTRVMTGAAV